MRILYINKVSPKLGGGAELRLNVIGSYLVEQGHEFYVVCAKTDKSSINDEVVNGMKVFYVNTIPKVLFKFSNISFYLSRYLFFLFSFPKIFKHAKYCDLIIDDISPSPSLAYVASVLRKKPIIGVIHEYYGIKWFKMKDFTTAMLGLISNVLLVIFKYNVLIAVSENTKKILKKKKIRTNNIVTIPNGIYRKSNKIITSNKAKEDIIVTVGRLVKQKGHVYLIKALKEVIRVFPEIKLIIIGDGPMKNILQDLVYKSNLERNVKILGWVSEEKKNELMSSAKMFITPSLQEGFGIVLLEAMMFNLPIVANDLPVFREIASEKCVHFVNVKEVNSFSESIISLLKNENIKKCMISNYENQLSKYDWQNICSQYDCLIRNIANNFI